MSDKPIKPIDNTPHGFNQCEDGWKLPETTEGTVKTGTGVCFTFPHLSLEESIAAAAAFGEELNLQALREDSPLKPFMCKACNSFGTHINTVNCCPNCGAELSDG